jgi:hypothetical protein
MAMIMVGISETSLVAILISHFGCVLDSSEYIFWERVMSIPDLYIGIIVILLAINHTTRQ